jgi:hypothetical protein
MPSQFISLSDGHPSAELVNIAHVDTASHQHVSAFTPVGSPRVADGPVVDTDARSMISSVTHNDDSVIEPVIRQI